MIRRTTIALSTAGLLAAGAALALAVRPARHDVPDQEIGAAMERLRAGLTEDGWGEFVTR